MNDKEKAIELTVRDILKMFEAMDYSEELQEYEKEINKKTDK